MEALGAAIRGKRWTRFVDLTIFHRYGCGDSWICQLESFDSTDNRMVTTFLRMGNMFLPDKEYEKTWDYYWKYLEMLRNCVFCTVDR